MDRIKLLFYNHRYLITIICLLILIFLLYEFYLKEHINKEEVIEQEKIVNNDIVSDNDYIYVDIKGAVNNPGVYKIFDNSRVIDAINSAGGLRDDADTSIINLSMKLHDEMSITIYTKEEVVNFIKVKEELKEKIEECNKTNEICINELEEIKDIDNRLININTASIEELKLIPKIGDVKAQNIIDYRNSIGFFNSIDEIKKVTGIGDNLFDQIKDYITV